MTLSRMAHLQGDALLSHANGGCYRCSRGSDLVDTDCSIVGEGTLVLCVGCVRDLAEAARITTNAARVAELEKTLTAEKTARLLAESRERRFLRALEQIESEPEEPETEITVRGFPVGEPRCTATTKAGNPCKGTPVPGSDVCRSHGGRVLDVTP